MLRRLPAILSGCALVAGFVWAPHVHLHRADGVRHAHLSPHAHEQHHDVRASSRHHDQDREQTADVLSADDFLSGAAVRICAPAPSEAAERHLTAASTATIGRLTDAQPRSHGPPGRDPSASRAPPGTPAF
jgi:hypothetical protein